MRHFRCVINIKNVELIQTFGRRLRELRVSGRLSQEQLANIAEMPISQIGRLERGENNPTLSTIGALAKALKIPIKVFFE